MVSCLLGMVNFRLSHFNNRKGRAGNLSLYLSWVQEFSTIKLLLLFRISYYKINDIAQPASHVCLFFCNISILAESISIGVLTCFWVAVTSRPRVVVGGRVT